MSEIEARLLTTEELATNAETRRVAAEANRRAVYARLLDLMAATRREDYPLVGILTVSLFGVGSLPIAGTAGGVDLVSLLAGVELLRVHTQGLAVARYPQYFGLEKLIGELSAQAKGYGDLALKQPDGSVKIECPCGHEGEAEREKAEWAFRALRELAAVVGGFYRAELPQWARDACDQLGALAVERLEELKPKRYYAEAVEQVDKISTETARAAEAQLRELGDKPGVVMIGDFTQHLTYEEPITVYDGERVVHEENHDVVIVGVDGARRVVTHWKERGES